MRVKAVSQELLQLQVGTKYHSQWLGINVDAVLEWSRDFDIDEGDVVRPQKSLQNAMRNKGCPAARGPCFHLWGLSTVFVLAAMARWANTLSKQAKPRASAAMDEIIDRALRNISSFFCFVDGSFGGILPSVTGVRCKVVGTAIAIQDIVAAKLQGLSILMRSLPQKRA